MKRKKRFPVAGAFLAPSVIGVLLFFVLPFFVVVYYSFVIIRSPYNLSGLKTIRV